MAAHVSNSILHQANERNMILRDLARGPGILVMPGAYDTITALLFQSMGFEATQGTSCCIAAQHGLHDGEYFTV
jgi:2-methylisocitrate lyase-like PEP mutase family enzyme